MLALTVLSIRAQEGPRVAEKPTPAGISKAPAKIESRWLAKKRTHVTQLTHKGPSPQEGEPLDSPPRGSKTVIYESGHLKLKAWYQPISDGRKHPTLVYLHGGFALGEDDLTILDAFHQAGFVIMTPALRGENGNPGIHELYCGELDDALAAIAWVKKQNEVDPARIVTFGHSAGGVLSALLSLYPDAAVLTGSCGGLYDVGVFEYRECPFDPKNRDESAIRVLPPNVAEMKTRHVAYVGKQDGLVMEGAKAAAEGAKAAGHKLLQIQLLEGDHFETLEPALKLFLAESQKAVSGLKAPPANPADR
ncbi:MAG: hypothetical protein CFE26_07010 [Verrucomicrobiales bacterium VVV1]|nr:MAG: hypothetical protein CFE26_07010 [Verrucomicrobiales bacterium VVV1]